MEPAIPLRCACSICLFYRWGKRLRGNYLFNVIELISNRARIVRRCGGGVYEGCGCDMGVCVVWMREREDEEEKEGDKEKEGEF